MGQAVLLIQPFLPHITNAELHQIMCSGFATMAGGFLVAYIDLGVSGEALISSCAMSVPISFVVSKLRYPELEEPFAAQYVVISESGRNDSVNFIHAFTNGKKIILPKFDRIF
jgi:CNT family concentrative nucleoside transporter